MDLSKMRKRTNQIITKPPTPTSWVEVVYRDGKERSRQVYPGTCPASGITTEYYDVVTKEFKKKSASGDVIVSPMYKKVHNVILKPFTGSMAVVGDAEKRDTQTGQGTLPPVPFPKFRLEAPANLVDNAITKAFAGVNANEANVPLWLGEAKEGVKMFCDIGASLYSLYRATATQREKYLKGKMSIKEMQGMTLALQYGILPLEQQLDDFSKLFKMKKDQRYTSRGFKNHEDSTTYTYDIENNGSTKVVVSCAEKLVVHVRAGVLYDVNCDGLSAIERYVQPGEIASAAWALSRLSFVIDWFINVGDTIKSWSPATGCNILGQWVTVEETRTITLDAHYVDAYPGYPEYNINLACEADLEVTVKTRERVDPLSRPIIPRISVDLNLSKVFSLILLFTKIRNK